MRRTHWCWYDFCQWKGLYIMILFGWNTSSIVKNKTLYCLHSFFTVKHDSRVYQCPPTQLLHTYPNRRIFLWITSLACLLLLGTAKASYSMMPMYLFDSLIGKKLEELADNLQVCFIYQFSNPFTRTFQDLRLTS